MPNIDSTSTGMYVPWPPDNDGAQDIHQGEHLLRDAHHDNVEARQDRREAQADFRRGDFKAGDRLEHDANEDHRDAHQDFTQGHRDIREGEREGGVDREGRHDIAQGTHDLHEAREDRTEANRDRARAQRDFRDGDFKAGDKLEHDAHHDDAAAHGLAERGHDLIHDGIHDRKPATHGGGDGGDDGGQDIAQGRKLEKKGHELEQDADHAFQVAQRDLAHGNFEGWAHEVGIGEHDMGASKSDLRKGAADIKEGRKDERHDVDPGTIMKVRPEIA